MKVTLLLLLVLTVAGAQRKPQHRGPRATALAVMSPDSKSVARLIPLCIRDNDRFWDASIYQASPVPMALEPGIVYELLRTGKSLGLFTISQPAQELGAWIGLGTFQPPQPRVAAAAATTGRADDDERPVLRRGQPPAAAAPAPSEPAAPPPPPLPDPDRPVLKRGKPAPGSEPAVPSTPAAPPASGPTASAPAPKPPELVPAISDADGPEARSFVFERNADEEARLRKATLALVEEAVLKQAGLASSAARLEAKESSFRFFDLDGNNGAEVVLTARLALAPQVPAASTRRRQPPAHSSSHPPSIALREFYVTFVAREDLNTDLHSSFTRITDARDLDLDGRLELIDAADVDGDGRGELIFRRVIGRDVSYAVFKVGLSQATKLFDSAGD